jgi:hypothetical protein
VDCIDLAQVRDKGRTLVINAMKFSIPELLGIYRLAEGLVNSQAKLWFMELVTYLVC